MAYLFFIQMNFLVFMAAISPETVSIVQNGKMLLNLAIILYDHCIIKSIGRFFSNRFLTL